MRGSFTWKYDGETFFFFKVGRSLVNEDGLSLGVALHLQTFTSIYVRASPPPPLHYHPSLSSPCTTPSSSGCQVCVSLHALTPFLVLPPHLAVSSIRLLGWGCSSVGRMLDRHTADTGSIPSCGMGIFSQSLLSVQMHTVSTHSPCCALTSVCMLKIL